MHSRKTMSCRHIEIAFVILFAFINIVTNQEWPSPILLQTTKPVIEKCIGEVGIDQGFLDGVRKGNLPDDEKLKSYLFCVFKAHDLISYEHHDFEYWKILSMIPKEMRKPAFDMGKGCLQVKGQDYLKASLDFVKCLYKHDPERFSFLI